MALSSTSSRLGIIAGSGDLPRMIIESCRQQNRPFFVLAFTGETDRETVAPNDVPHKWVTLGAIGKSIRLLKEHGVTDIVMAGRIGRPKLSDLRPDFGTFRLIAKIAALELTGDDALLSIVIKHLESHGFRVVGVESLVDGILSPEGQLTKIAPDAQAKSDIRLAMQVAKVLGAFDVGQSVVVQNGVVLGVEALEGTDALLERVAILRQNGVGGVLVKACKPKQESRVDLPTIGVTTVKKVAAAGLRGIAVETGASLMLYKEEVAREADALGVFVTGTTVDESAG